MLIENNNRRSRRIKISIWKTAREQQGVTWQHSTVVNNVATTMVPLLDPLPCESLGGSPYTRRVPQLAIQLYLMFYLIMSFLARRNFSATHKNIIRYKQHLVTLKTENFAGWQGQANHHQGGEKLDPRWTVRINQRKSWNMHSNLTVLQ
jgi:hypothetical protein